MIVETTNEIFARLLGYLQSNPTLYNPNSPDPTQRGLTSPSQVAEWASMLNIYAIEFAGNEQRLNLFETTIEGLISAAIPETPPWIRQQCLNFQYSATVPQIAYVQPNFSVAYSVINNALCIVTQCSVTSSGAGNIIIKVATGVPGSLGPLDGSAGNTGPEVLSLISYLQLLLGSDIIFQVINQTADSLAISGTVFYNGQYNGTIQTAVINAINAYLNGLPFNGVLKYSAFVAAILAVPGVTDFMPGTLTATPNGGTGISFILNGDILNREYSSYAGYIVNADSTNAGGGILFQIDNN